MILYIGLAVAAVLFGTQTAYFVWYPSQLKNDTPERAQAAKKRLASIIATPSLLGNELKISARYRLAQLHLADREYAAAAEQHKIILDILARRSSTDKARPALEADVRRRYADCLEGLGDRYGALSERQRVAQCLASKGANPLALLTSGRLLAQEGRHSEAYENYARALHLIPPRKADARAEVLVEMATASFHAGRPEQAIEAAESALDCNPKPALRILAHSMAGVGYSTQGNITESERHRTTALDLATASGNKEQVAHVLAQLANIERKRGNLAEAIDLARKAGAMTAGAKRQSDLIEAESQRLRGDYPAARQCMQSAQQGKPYAKPSDQRRMQGVFLLGSAWIELEAQEPQTALDFLQQAAALFPEDGKLSVWCQISVVNALTMLGHSEPMQQTLNWVEAKLPEFANDRETQMNAATMRARVAFMQADYARSLSLWEAYLALKPDPVEQPKGWYHIGECHFQMKDWQRAQEAYARSVGFGFDTAYVRKSQQRLTEIQQMPSLI